MSVRQFPGDLAKRGQNQEGAADLHGVVPVARRDEPSQSEATDLSNVLPFARPRRAGAAAAFPLPSIAPDERPTPQIAKVAIGASIAFFAASLALHGALLTMFWHQPRPMASVGVESMTIEVTLGATTAAGLAPAPGEQEAQAVPSSENPAREERVTEQSRAATVMPQEVPVAAVDAAPDVKPEEVRAESPAPTEATERTDQPSPQVQAVQQAPERSRIDAATDKQSSQKKQAAAAPPTDSASGIGRGRSERSSNYEGAVVAHITRHNQFPAAVRRAAGARGASSEFAVTVEYGIDGEGRVTSTTVLVGSGDEAIDRAVIAMIQKASPVPRPPDGQPRKFKQKLSYRQQLIHR